MSARREASKRLGIELQLKYEDLCNATGQDEVAHAAVLLGACFNANIEQICWFLKAYGGMKQLPLEKRTDLPKTPDFLVN
jgi:hypothetical protein